MARLDPNSLSTFAQQLSEEVTIMASQRDKPRCYFCAAHKPLKQQEFHVTIKGKLVLEKHQVCEECQKQHLAAYH